MITQYLLEIVFSFVRLIINLLPPVYILKNLGSIGSVMRIISKGFIIFPAGLWISCIVCFAFWKTAQLGWVIIEWLYKKIPGVN